MANELMESQPEQVSAATKVKDKTPAFAKPITIAGVNYTHFKLRESTVDDMFESEMELARIGGGTHTPLIFNGEMMTRQLLQVSNAQGGTFEGPFTMNMLKSWGTRNYRALRNAQIEVDLLGEDVQSE
jgi:phage FluMu protein gp41